MAGRGVKRIGLYPGTFDPITNGHLDIIGRAVKLVDKLIIGVAINEGKDPLFTLEERTKMVMDEARKLANGVEIEARPFDNLLMHFAEQCGAQMIIRGLRAVSDFEYEFQMVAMNQRMNDEIETVFLMADPHHQAVSSRLVKEIARLGGRADLFVPEAVHEKLLGKYGTKKGR
ncbi:MAG: pantetheine-phosphate adenylyltransferase [Hyphomonadaceae bacterium]|nr:pantetheine-phosphate adenylyltransferase [Hyphomonadaceae bacterium]